MSLSHPKDRAAVIAHIQSDLEARHPFYHVGIRFIGPRRDLGVYSYYDVEYFCGPKQAGMIGGSNQTTFQFDNDAEDAALRSASL